MKINILLGCIALLSLSLLAYRWHVWRNELVTVTVAWYDGDSLWRIEPPINVKSGQTLFFATKDGEEILVSKKITFPIAGELKVAAKRKDIR